jgi:hypothetical protein
VNWYNADSAGTIRQGNNFFIWNGYWELSHPSQDVLSDYSTAYLFFQWLRLHSSNARGIYRDIIRNAAVGVTDYRAVTQAVQKRIPAMYLSSDSDWETLQRNWLLANWIQSATTIYGYKSQISTLTNGKFSQLTKHSFAAGQSSTSLYAGEGVVTKIEAASFTPPAGSGKHIKYVGINGENFSTSTYTGYLLTFNANPNNASIGSSEKGFLATSITPPLLSRSVADTQSESSDDQLENPYDLPDSWPIDAGVLLARRAHRAE